MVTRREPSPHGRAGFFPDEYMAALVVFMALVLAGVVVLLVTVNQRY